jgi:hypothetical protein
MNKKLYYASQDQGCEFFYITDLTEAQIKYINENLDLEVENDDEPDFINFNYSCNCSADIDLREYLENDGFKEIEDPHYTDGFIEILRSWNQEPLKRPLNVSITK